MAAKLTSRFSPTLEALEDRCLLSAGLSPHRHVPAVHHAPHRHPAHHARQQIAINYAMMVAALPAADLPAPAGDPAASTPATTPPAAGDPFAGPPAPVADPWQPPPAGTGGSPGYATPAPAPSTGGQDGDLGRLWGDIQAQVTPQNASDAEYVRKGLIGVAVSVLGGDYTSALNQTKQVGDFLTLERALMGSNSLVTNTVANDYNQLYADMYAVWYHWDTSPLPGYGGGANLYGLASNYTQGWLYSMENTGPGSMLGYGTGTGD